MSSLQVTRGPPTFGITLARAIVTNILHVLFEAELVVYHHFQVFDGRLGGDNMPRIGDHFNFDGTDYFARVEFRSLKMFCDLYQCYSSM